MVNTRPNVRPKQAPHSECWHQEWEQRGIPGDVRRCAHDKIQILTRVSVDAPVQGPGTHWWRDLHWLWDWKTYRLAQEALQAFEEDQLPLGVVKQSKP